MLHNLDFQATTHPNGKFESQTMCNEDKTDGYRVCWYESGKIKSATEYKHSKPDGLYTAWHKISMVIDTVYVRYGIKTDQRD